MMPNLLNLNRRLPPLSQAEVYQSLVNALDDRSGFGILFIQCSPAEAERLIPRLQDNLPEKNMAVLSLEQPISNLYRLIEQRSDLDRLNVLFIRGLEKSLEADIKPGYGGLGDYYNLNTVPLILNHLNQQREGFRDDFPGLCFVFILPKFGIRYFVRRAPDFHDWNSGVFEVRAENEGFQIDSYSVSAPEASTDKNNLFLYIKRLLAWLRGNWQKAITIELDYSKAWNNQGISLNNSRRYEEAITSFDKAIAIELDLHEAWHNRGISLRRLGRCEEAIASFDKAIAIEPDLHEAWYNRGITLSGLRRYEEAITSFDKAIAIQPDKYRAWNNRGITLVNLGEYEEAITSFDKAAIQPNDHDAWYNRGIALSRLGRYEEAIASYDKTIAIQPDDHEAWYNRGIALSRLGRYEEVIASYDKAIIIKPDKDEAWYNRGITLGNLGRYEEAIASYDKAIIIKPDKDEAWYNRGIALSRLGDMKK